MLRLRFAVTVAASAVLGSMIALSVAPGSIGHHFSNTKQLQLPPLVVPDNDDFRFR